MSNRNLRRIAGKKNAADLAHMIHGLKELSGGLSAAIPEAQRDLAEAQAYLKEHRNTIDDLRYQLERQRAVFLRLFSTPGWDDLLATEAQFGAEYDAMRFLCWVAMLREDT